MRLIKLISIGLFFLSPLVSPVHASTIFSDDFEWGSDWNSSQGNTAPIANGWTGRLCVNRGGSYEAAYVNSAGAKQGSRGFIQYWDQTASQGSAQDAWLYRTNTAIPDEFYLGYWLQFDPSWDWGSAAGLKLLKVHFNDDTTWDIIMTNFCAGCESWRVPTGCGFAYCTDEYGKNWFGCFNTYASGWHYYVWHIKHSTGVLELKIDGVDAAKTAYATAYPGTGFDSAYGISFGGNIADGGGGVNEMWTAYDDLIIATTRAEVEDFLGVSDASPAPPTISNAIISNGSVQ